MSRRRTPATGWVPARRPAEFAPRVERGCHCCGGRPFVERRRPAPEPVRQGPGPAVYVAAGLGLSVAIITAVAIAAATAIVLGLAFLLFLTGRAYLDSRR